MLISGWHNPHLLDLRFPDFKPGGPRFTRSVQHPDLRPSSAAEDGQHMGSSTFGKEFPDPSRVLWGWDWALRFRWRCHRLLSFAPEAHSGRSTPPGGTRGPHGHKITDRGRAPSVRRADTKMKRKNADPKTGGPRSCYCPASEMLVLRGRSRSEPPAQILYSPGISCQLLRPTLKMER